MIGVAAHHGRWIGCARSPARANRIRADTLRIGWDKARILRDRRYAGSTPMRLSTSDEQHADASQASPTHDVFSLACLPRTMRTLFRVASQALAARWHTWHTRATARSAQRHAQAPKRGIPTIARPLAPGLGAIRTGHRRGSSFTGARLLRESFAGGRTHWRTARRSSRPTSLLRALRRRLECRARLVVIRPQQKRHLAPTPPRSPVTARRRKR